MPEIVLKFISDMIDMPFDRAYLNNIYGEDQVATWLTDMAILKAIKIGNDEKKLARAKNKDLFLEDILRFRNKAMQNMTAVMNDKTHKDHVRVSTLFMSAELAYIEAYFKAKGEQDALAGEAKMGTILEFIRGQKTN
jgi:hypothetical protein